MWSFVDLLEFGSGYTLPMGLYHLKFDEACERVPKQSAYWYSDFIKTGGTIKIKKVGKRSRAQPAHYSSF